MTSVATPVIACGIDLESTGLNQAEGHRIIEIAMDMHDITSGRHLGSFVRRINPQRGIEPDAQAVHHISLDDVLDCKTWEEEAPIVAQLCSKVHFFVAHNGKGFDLPFLYGELARVGQPIPNAGLMDTMLNARWATPDGALPNLRALCFACGVDYDPAKAHAALYDVQVMMECYRKYQQYFGTPELYHFVPMVPKERKTKKEA